MRRLTAILTLLVLGASVLVGCDRAVAGTRGRALDPGGPKERTILALLAMSGGPDVPIPIRIESAGS